jgi:opacity protein-like surface antigen
MRRTLVIVAVLCLCCGDALAQQPKPWFSSIDFGESQIKLNSDQNPGGYNPSFALGFTAGHRLGQRARIGGQINGQLLQAFNLNDPTVGESVSHVFAIADILPVRNRTLFLRGGTGLSMYTNNHLNGIGGHGLGWTFGGGYEFPVTKMIALAPTITYTGARFNDRRDITPALTGRRFSAVDFRLAFVFHFGHENR